MVGMSGHSAHRRDFVVQRKPVRQPCSKKHEFATDALDLFSGPGHT